MSHAAIKKINIFLILPAETKTSVPAGCFSPTTTRRNNKFMSKDISQTITRIAEIIINELKLEDVTPETFDPDLDLVDEVGIDSMDMATVALFLSDEYEIQIDEDDYPKLTTVRIIAQYIDDKLNSNE